MTTSAIVMMVLGLGVEVGALLDQELGHALGAGGVRLVSYRNYYKIYFFNKSRISVSRATSSAGSAGASSSFFFRLLMVLSNIKITKAIIKKSIRA